MPLSLPFAPAPRIRATLKTGTLFAIDGEDGFIYFGQLRATAMVGFFRYRSQQIVMDEALAAPIMSCFYVNVPSIGQALRSGRWLQLGIQPLHAGLFAEPITVQWAAGTLDVELWQGGGVIGTTQIHDPAIQDLEIMAAFDATSHVPHRLRADYADDKNDWQAGGTVRRQRLQKEAMAERFPDAAWHHLPAEWVRVENPG